jgi:putative FmdB family regulatory protein
MPLYEFVCSNCNEKYTILTKMNSHRRTVACAKCGDIARRIISTSNFQIDGPGTWAYTKRMTKDPRGK